MVEYMNQTHVKWVPSQGDDGRLQWTLHLGNPEPQFQRARTALERDRVQEAIERQNMQDPDDGDGPPVRPEDGELEDMPAPSMEDARENP